MRDTSFTLNDICNIQIEEVIGALIDEEKPFPTLINRSKTLTHFIKYQSI